MTSSVSAHLPDTIHTTGKVTSAKAAGDLWEGLKRAPLWWQLAWQDIRLRYRGSMLGPFWLSLSMGITVVALGFVYGALFGQPLATYMPFLVAGLMSWNFISTTMNEACTCFTQAESFIKKIRQPFSVYVYRTICKNLIILAHNFVIYLIVIAVFDVWPGISILWFLPALGLIILNSVWVCFLLGMICARFRDVTQIVNSLTAVIFLVTPIIWRADALHGRGFLVKLNPFYHFVALMRQPLLGQVPILNNWLVALSITVIGMAVSFLFFRRFRARLAYWV